jgi:hypothetical protein
VSGTNPAPGRGKVSGRGKVGRGKVSGTNSALGVTDTPQTGRVCSGSDDFRLGSPCARSGLPVLAVAADEHGADAAIVGLDEQG